jgi:hypothetical protein
MNLIEWSPRPNGDLRDLSDHWCSSSPGEGGGIRQPLGVRVGEALIPTPHARSVVPCREREAVLAGGGGR